MQDGVCVGGRRTIFVYYKMCPAGLASHQPRGPTGARARNLTRTTQCRPASPSRSSSSSCSPRRQPARPPPRTSTAAAGCVIVRAVRSTTTIAGAYNDRRRLVEDEVSSEFAGLLLGADDDHVSSGALIKNKAVCIHNCGGKGPPYTRPCANIYQSQGC